MAPSGQGYLRSVVAPRWRVSLHGGHSGEFCEHASDTLREVLEAAVTAGISTFGVTEHAPRSLARFLYRSERAKGYTTERLAREFEAYARTSRNLLREFRGRLEVVRGFEAEVVPSSGYADEMGAIRERHGFDYMVGSVHHVAEISIDESADHYKMAVAACGGLEPFFERYYSLVSRMIEDLRPEVVGHLDLPKLHAPAGANLATLRIRRAAERAVESARRRNCILDLNTAAWRKGLPEPYPSPWLVRLASQAGVPFCFGDDSHGVDQVGFGIDRARRYLIENGIDSITCLTRRNGSVERRRISLTK